WMIVIGGSRISVITVGWRAGPAPSIVVSGAAGARATAVSAGTTVKVGRSSRAAAWPGTITTSPATTVCGRLLACAVARSVSSGAELEGDAGAGEVTVRPVPSMR